MAALAVYVASLIAAFAFSGLFHLLPRGSPAHAVAARLDYAAVFVLIAGSFTPPYIILFRGAGRWATLAFIWGVAVAGVVLKTIYFDRISHGQSVLLFLAMGWTGLAGGVAIWRRFGFSFAQPLFAGGLAYTIGTYFDQRGSGIAPWAGVIQGHEIWHLAVLLGAAFHWAFIYGFADGKLPPEKKPSLPTVIK